MSVVGLDFGNSNNVVALARRKGIDVVLNTESKRETPSMVNFGEKQVRNRVTSSAPRSTKVRSPLSNRRVPPSKAISAVSRCDELHRPTCAIEGTQRRDGLWCLCEV